jgi:hypothetical protein
VRTCPAEDDGIVVARLGRGEGADAVAGVVADAAFVRPDGVWVDDDGVVVTGVSDGPVDGAGAAQARTATTAMSPGQRRDRELALGMRVSRRDDPGAGDSTLGARRGRLVGGHQPPAAIRGGGRLG